MPITPCPVCYGFGFLPFKRKDGKVVSHAWVDCCCKEPIQEHSQDSLVPHWCELHQEHFFKTRRMFSYAHPILNTGRWCSEPKAGGYREKRPEDFDFPVSHDFHRFICQEYGHGDPGDNETARRDGGMVDTADLRPAAEKRESSNLSLGTDHRIDRLQGELVSLRDSLSSHMKPRKKIVPKWA